MDILKFVLLNWDSVIVVLVIIAGLIVLIARKQFTILDKIVFTLVTEAEKKYGGGGTGTVKLAAVVGWLYPKIPAVIRLFLSVEQIEAIIERVLADAKSKWDSSPIFSSYITKAE
jgi:hypothetical protein